MHMDSTPRACAWCGAPIIQRPTEQNLHFAKRVSCNPSCGNKARWARDKSPIPEKQCVVCGGDVPTVSAQARQQRKRLTCSHSCKITLANRRRYAKVEPEPKPCVICGTEIRRRDGFICQECGCAELIHRSHAVHHIDYDKSHCELSNLITLCQPCHVRTNWNREYWTARFSA